MVREPMVADRSPMRRGLKGTKLHIVAKSSSRVADRSPMRRGLKVRGLSGLFLALHSVADRSPMRRGLKVQRSTQPEFPNLCCRPFPDEEGTESSGVSYASNASQGLQTVPR